MSEWQTISNLFRICLLSFFVLYLSKPYNAFSILLASIITQQRPFERIRLLMCITSNWILYFNSVERRILFLNRMGIRRFTFKTYLYSTSCRKVCPNDLSIYYLLRQLLLYVQSCTYLIFKINPEAANGSCNWRFIPYQHLIKNNAY